MIKKSIRAIVEAFKNIKTNLLRTLLSILGIVIGVSALVVILSLIDGMEKFALDQISSTTGLESILLESDKYERVDGVRMEKDSLKTINYKEYLAMLEEIEIKGRGYLIYTKTGRIYSQSNSVGGTARFVNESEGLDFKLLSGTIPKSATYSSTSLFAVVNTNLVKALFPKDSFDIVIGKMIKFDTVELKIMAVISTEEKETASFFVPYTILNPQYLVDNNPRFMIRANNIKEVPMIKSSVEGWLEKHLGKKHDMEVITNEFRVEQVNQGFLLFRLIMGLIVGISVVVGGIGVMNVMIISVTERIKEIGIRKAVGAKRKEILMQFLSESIAISSLGSFVGLIVGVMVTLIAVPIVKMITKIPFQAAFTVNTLIVIGIIAIAVGVIFGTYPALKASKLDPVDAIRKE